MNYPDGLRGRDFCYMEGCLSNPCSRCGKTDYRALGYEGARTRWAKAWGVTKDEAMNRFKIPKELEAPDA